MSEPKPEYNTIKSIMPFDHQGYQYVSLRADTIRSIVPFLSKSAWCILTWIVYQIEGFSDKEDGDKIPYEQFKKYTAVKSNTAISTALKELTSLGLISKSRYERNKVATYTLNLSVSIEILLDRNGKRIGTRFPGRQVFYYSKKKPELRKLELRKSEASVTKEILQ